ncbi:MAG: hypothetical protein JSS66_06035 [Armatimonadetes bacterium]|nr:hypothetical protein [Armatimonadota bacterium]
MNPDDTNLEQTKKRLAELQHVAKILLESATATDDTESMQTAKAVLEKTMSMSWEKPYRKEYAEDQYKYMYRKNEYGYIDKYNEFAPRNLTDEIEGQFELVGDYALALRRDWVGHWAYKYRGLSPDELTSMFEQAKEFQDSYAYCVELCDEMGGVAPEGQYSNGPDWLAQLQEAYSWHVALAESITESYSRSSGKDIGQVHLPRYRAAFSKDEEAMLEPVLVTPWNCPEAPEFEIPEKPAVVLSVLSCEGNEANVGYIDPFGDLVMAPLLVVDEPLSRGQVVVVRASGWEGDDEYLTDPEYDGLAEESCPVSEPRELRELKYDFRPEDVDDYYARHRENWLREHWIPVNSASLYDKAAEYDDKARQKAKNDKARQKAKKTQTWDGDYTDRDKYVSTESWKESRRRYLHEEIKMLNQWAVDKHQEGTLEPPERQWYEDELYRLDNALYELEYNE